MNRFLGYDPGGNGAHGVAAVEVNDEGQVVAHSSALLANADAVVNWATARIASGGVAGIGVDTITEWCLGDSGWRPADLWLRANYASALLSVMAPNSISGSMSLNGMGVLCALRGTQGDLVVSETHPKVLYLALSERKYSWAAAEAAMITWLSAHVGAVAAVSEHEWDALISAWACAQGVLGRWTLDLHQPLPGFAPTGRMVRPAGATNYFWPAAPRAR